MAFEKWQFTAGEMKRQQAMLGGALKRMVLRQVSMAFEKWQFTAGQMAEEARKLRQAVMRMVARQLAAGFGTWREMAMMRKAMLGLAERCVRRMRNAALYGGWGKWRVMAAEAGRQRKAMGGALKRLVQQQLSKAFEKWQFTAAELKEEARKLRQAAMRMVIGKLVAGFGTLRAQAAEAHFLGRRMESAIRHMMLRHQSIALRKWQLVAAEMAEEARKLRQAVIRMVAQQMAAGFWLWREMASGLRCEEVSYTQACGHSEQWSLHWGLGLWRSTALRIAEGRKSQDCSTTLAFLMQLSSAWQVWREFSQTVSAYSSMGSWMARLFATTHDNALAGIRRASHARAHEIWQGDPNIVGLQGMKLSVRRYTQRLQATHVAHVVLRKSMQALKEAMLTWKGVSVASRAVYQTQRDKQALVANIMVRNMRTSSAALRMGRLARATLIWRTALSAARQWRQHSFNMALTTAASKAHVRARHVKHLAWNKLRTNALLRALLVQTANQRNAVEEGRRGDNRRLLATVMGHHMHTAAAELHMGRMARGFGMWRAFMVAAQEARRASFGAHINAYVRHSRRIVLQWGFRRWLVWTWQDRFVTLEEQFGLCQTALCDLELDVKRLEKDNAELENSRLSDATEKNELSLDAHESSLRLQQMEDERSLLLEQNQELREHTQNLMITMEQVSSQSHLPDEMRPRGHSGTGQSYGASLSGDHPQGLSRSLLGSPQDRPRYS